MEDRNAIGQATPPHQVAVLNKVDEVLVPDGYLLLGPGQTAQGLSNAFQPMDGAPGLYTKARRALPRMAAG